jgi:hypothetical protein
MKIVFLMKLVPCYEELWGVEVYSSHFRSRSRMEISGHFPCLAFIPREQKPGMNWLGWAGLRTAMNPSCPSPINADGRLWR